MKPSENVNYTGQGIERTDTEQGFYNFDAAFEESASIPNITPLSVSGQMIGHIIKEESVQGTQFIISAMFKEVCFEGSKHHHCKHFTYETSVSSCDKETIQFYNEALEEAHNTLGVENEEA